MPSLTKVRSLNGALFFGCKQLLRSCGTEICKPKQISCAQSADHILKDEVSSKTTVFECAQKSNIFDIGKHFDIIYYFRDTKNKLCCMIKATQL